MSCSESGTKRVRSVSSMRRMKRAAGVAGVQPVEQRGAGAAQVEVAGGAGRHADANGRVDSIHGIVPISVR